MALTVVRPKAKKSGHTRAVAPTIDLNQEGRLRVANLLAILAVSHSTLYQGLRSGRYPPADGFDGNMPYWTTQTIREFCATHRERSKPVHKRRRTPSPPSPELLRMLGVTGTQEGD